MSAYLLAVVGGVLHTHQVVVGPSVQVAVLSTNVAISCVPGFALTAEHGLAVDAQVNAVCISVAVVAAILTRITGLANLEGFHENSESEGCFLSIGYSNARSRTCFLAVACSTPLPKGWGPEKRAGQGRQL